MNGILYRLVSKDDISDEPDTLQPDIIEALRDEATPVNPIDSVPAINWLNPDRKSIVWVKSVRKWGFADLVSHWLFAFYPCESVYEAPVILPTVYILPITPIEPRNPYRGGAL